MNSAERLRIPAEIAVAALVAYFPEACLLQILK